MPPNSRLRPSRGPDDGTLAVSSNVFREKKVGCRPHLAMRSAKAAGAALQEELRLFMIQLGSRSHQRWSAGVNEKKVKASQ